MNGHGIRVLEAISSAHIGGAETFVTSLCATLPDLGAQVHVFCPQGRAFVDYALERNVPCTSWRTRGKLDPITVVRLARLIRVTHADVVHTHLSTASLLGALAARLARRPSVAHVHGLNTATCFRCSNAIIAVSDAVKAHLCAQGIPSHKVRVIHNGVDLARFQPAPIREAKRAAGLSESAPVVGIFGRLSPEKGQRLGIEAMFLVLKDCPNAQLLIVGGGPDRDELALCAQALGIESSVRLTGFVEDVRPLMSACDVVAVPSLKEGFGLAAVEAMALERPVVAAAVGGLTEIVAPDTGALVKPGDPQALAEAVSALLSDPALAQSMGQAGRATVEERFDLAKQVRATYSFLCDIAAHRAPVVV